MGKKNIFISKDQVAEMNQAHGWFQYGDAQSDVSNAFANEAIERYERIRSAAPELLEALRGMLQLDEENHQRYPGDEDVCTEVRLARAAIAKAVGIV